MLTSGIGERQPRQSNIRVRDHGLRVMVTLYTSKPYTARRTDLHVLPEVHVAVIEDVGVEIEIVKALRAENHPDVVAAIK